MIWMSGRQLGVLSTYSGDEFNRAIAAFSAKYPKVEITVVSGNHEDIYDGLRFGRIDLALNDQRRAFSDAYENLVLMETACYVELASHNPLSRLDTVSVDTLKNTPCILVASPEQQEEEQRFYRDIIGFKGEFLFADTLQAARVMVVSNRGIMARARFSGKKGWLVRAFSVTQYTEQEKTPPAEVVRGVAVFMGLLS